MFNYDHDQVRNLTKLIKKQTSAVKIPSSIFNLPSENSITE